MVEFYDAEGPAYYRALQRRINDGSIWSLEGSAGRAAMSAIEAGLCVLGRRSVRDYWGSFVPGRRDVKSGTKGSVSYAQQLQGERWARSISRIK